MWLEWGCGTIYAPLRVQEHCGADGWSFGGMQFVHGTEAGCISASASDDADGSTRALGGCGRGVNVGSGEKGRYGVVGYGDDKEGR